MHQCSISVTNLYIFSVCIDDGTCDRSVSVLLDGEESQLVFIDHPHGEISVSNKHTAETLLKITPSYKLLRVSTCLFFSHNELRLIMNPPTLFLQRKLPQFSLETEKSFFV